MIILTNKMIRILILFFSFLFFLTSIYAEPSDNRPVTITQADGTKLTVILHGDEFFSYTTTLSGDPIAHKDGFFYYVSYNMDGQMQFSNQRVSQHKNASGERAYLSRRQTQNMRQIASVAAQKRRQEMFPRGMQRSSFPTTGIVKAIVILVEYQDVRFQSENTRQKFSDRLNTVGYSDYPAVIPGAIGVVKGSARDYFLKVSDGQFIGQFDVVGPYRLDNNMAYYGTNNEYGNDIRPQEMVIEATTKAHTAGVNFAQYDYDGDGFIDNVFLFYAGYAESNNPDMPNTIWPHKWSVNWLSGSPFVFNGKNLDVYACTSELRTENTMAGLGTFLHEFGHVFGLADHYDTDGDANGHSQGLGKYDIMTSGSHNNNGYTPPMYTALEMEICDWLMPTIITNNTGNYQLPTIDNHVAYRINTEVEGEYFLIENRQKNDPNNHWDNHIPGSGMLITHVDRSASSQNDWYSNRPNTNLSRERYRIVFANNQSNAGYIDWQRVVYPYYSNREFNKSSTPRAVSWSGTELSTGISNISESKSIMTFTGDGYAGVSGVVKDQLGAVMSNVCVSFIGGGNTSTFVTNAQGEYFSSFNLASGDYMINAYKSNYLNFTEDIVISTGLLFNFTMTAMSDGHYDIVKHHTDALENTFNVATSPFGAYIKLEKIEGRKYLGQRLTEVSVNIPSVMAGDIVISTTPDFMSESTTKIPISVIEATKGAQRIDISSKNIIIEDNMDYYIGIDFKTYTGGPAAYDNDDSGKYHGLTNLIYRNGSWTTAFEEDASVKGNLMLNISLNKTSPFSAVTSVIIDKAELSLPVGEKTQLIATVAPSGANQHVVWSSSNSTVATVDANGNVSAIKNGMAIIYAKDVRSETFVGQCEVTVGPVKFTTTPWQIDAQIKWESKGYDKFRITLKDRENQVLTRVDVEAVMYLLTDLMPATTYNLTISAYTDSNLYVELFSTSFMTIPKVTDFPLIYLSDYIYAKDTPILLKAINLSEGDIVSWKIDDKDVAETLVIFEAGQHTIKAVVRRRKTEYIAVKTILIQ